MNAKIDSLIDDIIQYMDYLKNTKKYYLTIHFFNNKHSPFMVKLYEYNNHYNPYCIVVKSSEQNWEKCFKCQAKIKEFCENDMFFGMCHAGVEEYVLPIYHNEPIGFISVSGYRVNEKEAIRRIKNIALDSNIKEELLIQTYMQKLNNKLPEYEEVKFWLTPLSNMFKFFHLQISEIHKSAGNIYSKNEDNIYSYIKWYIRGNINKRITMEELGKECNFSVTYISSIFKKKSGMTISKYINNLRIEKAKILLENTNFSVQEVAHMVGFLDANYFSKTFKETCGICATEYKSKHNSTNDI